MNFAPLNVVAWAALSALVATAAYADTSAIRQTQLEFLEMGGAGATAKRQAVPESDRDALFRSLDIDADGSISRSEAAGNAQVTLGFDRADRDRDGKLSRKEYDSIGKVQRTRQARSK